jgi:hypothetical protein
MNNTQTTNNKESWQSGYISNNTRLNEINLSQCDKSKVVVYSHPSGSNIKNKPVK